jgi:DNA-binding NarL/FixJ family response regulator
LSINVAVIDDLDIIQLGVRQSLSDLPHIHFVEGFSTLEAFARSDTCRKVDVVLLDDSLPEMDVAQAIQYLQEQCPDTAILLLGSRLTPGGIHQAVKAGASGVVCKDEPVQDVLVMGIRHAHTGKVYLSPRAALIAARIGQVPVLSQKLVEVLKLIARGYRVPAMMQELGISRKTVYRRRQRLLEILDVETNEQIVAEAIRRGLLGDEN